MTQVKKTCQKLDICSYLHALRFLQQYKIEPLSIGRLNGAIQHLCDAHLQKKLSLAGAMIDADGQEYAGRWLNLAHGSRGITGTPLCADWIADRISGLPVSVDSEMEQALEPKRFIERKRRRKRPRKSRPPQT